MSCFLLSLTSPPWGPRAGTRPGPRLFRELSSGKGLSWTQTLTAPVAISREEEGIGGWASWVSGWGWGPFPGRAHLREHIHYPREQEAVPGQHAQRAHDSIVLFKNSLSFIVFFSITIYPPHTCFHLPPPRSPLPAQCSLFLHLPISAFRFFMSDRNPQTQVRTL